MNTSETRWKKEWKTGDLIVFTSGDYSAYGIDAVARATRDFTEIEVLDSVYGQARTRIPHVWQEGNVNLLTWLVKYGWVEEIAWSEHNRS